MPNEPPQPPPLPGSTPAADPPIPFDIGAEFGTAKRNLPPAAPVLIALGIIAVIVGIYAFVFRAQPQGSGTVDNIAAVELPDQHSVLVALSVTLHNTGKTVLKIHSIKASLKTTAGEFSDDAASSVDFGRYFEAYPALKQGATPPLMPESKLQPGEQMMGTIVVSFPVSLDAFTQRQSISAIIQPDKQPLPVTLTK